MLSSSRKITKIKLGASFFKAVVWSAGGIIGLEFIILIYKPTSRIYVIAGKSTQSEWNFTFDCCKKELLITQIFVTLYNQACIFFFSIEYSCVALGSEHDGAK